MTLDERITDVKCKAQSLTDAIKEAENDGVPPALLIPELLQVFHEAGMLPDWFDMGSITAMLQP